MQYIPCIHALELTRRETLPPIPHQAGDRSELSHNSKTTGLNNRELKLHATVQTVLILLVPPRGSTEDSEQHAATRFSLWLQLITISILASRQEELTGLVTGEEWQGTFVPTGDSNHQVRCIPPGLWSSVQQHQDRESLELTSQSRRCT